MLCLTPNLSTNLVLGVEDDSLGVGDPADVVLVLGGRQPNSGRQLVVEQRQLRDQTLGLLLFGGQRGQTFPDAEQRLDELPLRSESLWLQGIRKNNTHREELKQDIMRGRTSTGPFNTVK